MMHHPVICSAINSPDCQEGEIIPLIWDVLVSYFDKYGVNLVDPDTIMTWRFLRANKWIA
jgi:hypothetical protein